MARPFWRTCPPLRGGLLWDDNMHVTRADLRSLHGLWRIWFDLGATQQYYPLLHSAFWLEHRLWGDAVLGYHLTNVALHAAVGLPAGDDRPAARSARRLAGRLFFALHPGMRGGGGLDLGAEEYALRSLLPGGRAHLFDTLTGARRKLALLHWRWAVRSGPA